MAYSRKHRYSKYRFAIKQLGATAGTEGSPIQKFLNYESGKVQITHVGTASLSKVERQILPFAVAANANPYLIGIGGRVINTGISDFGLGEQDLGISAVDSAKPPTEDKSFFAARAVAFKGGGTTTNKTSEVTGRAYKRKAGNSFTLPFGQKSGVQANFLGAVEYLKPKIETGNNTVTFQSERFFF